MAIKNIHYLNLEGDDLQHIDKAAGLYAANAAIDFKILKADDDQIIVEVRQAKNKADKYQDAAGLIDRSKKLFSRFFPNRAVHVRPKPYQRPVVDEATPEWIEAHMNRRGISIKQIAQFTGIDKTNLSAWINGKRPMSQPVQAMFYVLFAGSGEL